MKSKISIIVPIYKVEEYIEKCIESLINQTYKNIEIILVDDESPDNCPYICDSYAIKDNRIKVIHKTNGGLSDARNAGIKKSTGDYILFVDADDYINLDTCNSFIKLIENKTPDILVGNAIRIENNTTTYINHDLNTKGKTITGREYLKHEIKNNCMHMAAWMNLYNRDFLEKNNLNFKKDRLHEDEEFTPRAFLAAKEVIGTDITFYNYIIRNGSITKQKDLSKNGEHIIHTCYELSKIYEGIDDIELKNLLNETIAVNYLSAFQMGKLYRKKYKNLINKKFVLKNAYCKKTKIKSYIFALNKYIYFGINKINKSL